jgi:hypothetical protein
VIYTCDRLPAFCLGELSGELAPGIAQQEGSNVPVGQLFELGEWVGSHRALLPLCCLLLHWPLDKGRWTSPELDVH